MAKTLWMTKGLPASGKSTWAKQKLHEVGVGNAHRVNKDDLRSMLDDGQWSPANEKFLLGVRDYVVTSALNAGVHVIVDDTNLSLKHEGRLRELAKKCGAEFQVKDFTDVPLETCIERDSARSGTARVGKKVITDMYNQFLRKAVAPPAHDPSLPDVIVCDIDGTVASVRPGGRSHYDWKRVGEDLTRPTIINAVLGLSERTGAFIMFVSGRDACCYKETEKWIKEEAKMPIHSPTMLQMRPVGDMRKDAIVKGEIYEREIKGKLNVIAVFDDRDQICRAWDAMGLGDRLFRVGPVDRDDF